MNARCSCSRTFPIRISRRCRGQDSAELIGKRITGYLNWQIRRAPHHLPGTIDAIVNDVVAARPDHVVVTGDLVNLALPDEFAMARKFLARLGPPEKVSVIPGNHDFYVRGAEAGYLAAWREFLSADEAGNFRSPFLRRRGPVAIIGTSTADCDAAFFATGRLRGEQLARLESLLRESAPRKVLPRGADPSSARRLTARGCAGSGCGRRSRRHRAARRGA